MLVKASISYLTADPVGSLIVTVQSGLKGIGDNPQTFADPTPPLAVVQAALDALTEAAAIAKNGSVQDTANMYARRDDLVVLMRKLSNYVTDICNGDMVKLLSSSLPIQKPTRAVIGQLNPPAAPLLVQGKASGQINATTKPLKGAGSYTWQVALTSDPNVVLQTLQSLAARTSIYGLTPGQFYDVAVNAVGTAGVSDWSDTSAMMVI